jgi:hypothetical protein
MPPSTPAEFRISDFRKLLWKRPAFTGGAWHPDMTLSSNRRRQRSELRPHPKEEGMNHALATVLHRGRKAVSNFMSACLASSRGSASPGHKLGRG